MIHLIHKKEGGLFMENNNPNNLPEVCPKELALKENIPKQIQVIYPARVVRPEIERRRIIEEVERGERKDFSFLKEGVQGLIENEEDAKALALSLAQIKYSKQHHLLSDFACGLHTAQTNKGYSFYHKKTLIDDLTKDIESTVVEISHEAFWKLLFGPLVRENGRAIPGAGNIVKEAKKQIMPILTGKQVEPSVIASVNAKDGSKFVIEGKPILVKQWTKNTATIQIEHCFFPINSKGKTVDYYINQVAGLSSFLAFGLSQCNKNNQKNLLIRTAPARRILLAVQAAYQFKNFSPVIATENSLGKINILFKRSSVKDLCPTAINRYTDKHGNKKESINFQYFSNYVASVGKIYYRALQGTGIIDQISENILIPATTKGAEFPERIPNGVLLKMIKGNKIGKDLEFI